MKVVNTSKRDWSVTLHDSLWAYRTAYKTILGMSPIASLCKVCHLQLKCNTSLVGNQTLNMDLNRADVKRFLDLNEMEELKNDAISIQTLQNRDCKRKIEIKMDSSFTIHEVYSTGIVELLSSTGTFKVNGNHLKPFLEPFSKDKEKSTSLNHIKPKGKMVR
ncbi:hypothetical protein CK203_101790 [Vitis vinifera]|uniref:Uncharacterized protein n=1 Tax=Vitis vinifera TaxID=29760 RepID=A0A438FFW3_VITVI|nr:hypothetical protein CK203_101790 [Vitis vinifera]